MDSLREYLTSDDPEQRTRAERLRAAIGLQDVDSLTVSPFLVSLAERSIRGELCLAECRKELTAHYKEMIAGGSYDMGTADAEFAAINIAECLGDDRFSLTPAEFSSIHRRIFTGGPQARRGVPGIRHHKKGEGAPRGHRRLRPRVRSPRSP